MMRIGEAAKTLGICPGTFRNLERRGVVSMTRDQAGQRRFSKEDLLVLEEILFGQTTSPPQESEQ